MKLGVFTPVFGGLDVRAMLASVRELRHVQAVELGTGCWPGHDHLDLAALLDNAGAARDYRRMVEDAGLTISALSCHGNPLHPDAAIAASADDVFRRTVRLAEQLQVPVVVTFSGCPGDRDGARHPNWVTTAMASGVPGAAGLAVGEEGPPVLARRGRGLPAITASRWPSRRIPAFWSTTPRRRCGCGPKRGSRSA